MSETLQEKIARITLKEVQIENYNPNWKKLFEKEKRHLLKCSSNEIIKRIEHFGSTAIPKMPSKPIIDMLVEVTGFTKTKKYIVPVLVKQGYDYFWRPSFGENVPPYYCWFIKRDRNGKRTHHIHMVKKNYEHWDRLYFRDYLIEKPMLAKKYAALKIRLSKKYHNNRIVYTKEKTDFIVSMTNEAKKYYKNIRIIA